MLHTATKNGQKRHSNNQLLLKDGQVRPSLCQNRRSRFIWVSFSVGFVGFHSAAKYRGKKRVASCPRDFVSHNPSPFPASSPSLSLSRRTVDRLIFGRRRVAVQGMGEGETGSDEGEAFQKVRHRIADQSKVCTYASVSHAY